MNTNSAQILVSSQRSWLSLNSILGWTQDMVEVFSKGKKKKNHL
jgi:hypothetical protein